MKERRDLLAALMLPLYFLLVANSAVAQGGPLQVLEQLEVTALNAGLRMDTKPNRAEDNVKLFDASGQLVSCVRESGGDLFCLDDSDKTVKKLVIDASGPRLDPLIDCNDPKFDFRRNTFCTAHTFGLGAHFLWGINRGKTYSLWRIPDPTNLMTAEEYFTGRPLVLDGRIIEDEAFPGGTGIVSIEQRSDAVHCPVTEPQDPNAACTVLVSKKDWGIRGKVNLLSVDVFNKPDTTDYYVIGTTSDGRILSRRIGGTIVRTLFDIVTERDNQVGPGGSVPNSPFDPSQCNFDEQHYAIEIGDDAWYLTDKNFCQVTVLIPTFDGSGKLDGLNIVQETPPGGSARNLILSTLGSIYPPVYASASEGVSFDLGSPECATAEGCTFISGAGGAAAATWADVDVVEGTGAATAYQLKGLPFCPYKSDFCLDLLEIPRPTPDNRINRLAALVNAGVLFRLPDAPPIPPIPTDDPPRPEEYLFNVTPVLPDVVRLQLPLDDPDGPGGEEPRPRSLWLLPAWRARIDLNFFFEALFFATNSEDRDVWTLTVDVGELHGDPPGGPSTALGCREADDLPPGFVPDAAGLDLLLDKDVTTRVSERRRTINGPQSEDPLGIPIANYQNTEVNAGCGSTRNRTGGGSLFPYDFEPAWCQGVLNGEGDLSFDEDQGVVCVLDDTRLNDFGAPIVEVPDDAVFAKIYVKLYDELLADLDQLACGPLGDVRCDAARANWFNGKQKLTRALLAALFTPTNCSGGSRNFGAVQSQLQNYGAILVDPTLGPYNPDPDNRVGGQRARVETLLSMLLNQVLPSIPSCPEGLHEDDDTWIYGEFVVPPSS